MKQHHPSRAAGRAAFTLVELLVVIGLMAMLGTISVGGYFAAVRGMADRGALQDTISLIRLAQQTCLIDQTPTAVLFYNRKMIQTAAAEDVSSQVGMAVAIKMAGRISYINNNILVDEFADWNQSYPVAANSISATGGTGIRFYRMANLDRVADGITKCSSLMTPFVTYVDLGNEYMIAAGKQVRTFCSDFSKEGADNQVFSGTAYANGNNQRWGFRFSGGSGSGIGQSEWHVGDAYGVEIGTLQLPNGYIFGSPSSGSGSTGINSVPSLKFRPSDVTSWDKYEFQSLGNTVEISAYRPNGLKSVGKIKTSDLKDEK